MKLTACIALGALLLAGIAGAQDGATAAPRPRVGLVLGGGAKGAAQGGRTPVGPFLLSLGFVDNGSWQLQFTRGRPVAEGSLLDEAQ